VEVGDAVGGGYGTGVAVFGVGIEDGDGASGSYLEWVCGLLWVDLGGFEGVRSGTWLFFFLGLRLSFWEGLDILVADFISVLCGVVLRLEKWIATSMETFESLSWMINETPRMRHMLLQVR